MNRKKVLNLINTTFIKHVADINGGELSKRNWIGKDRIKMLLFTHGVTKHMENPKEFTNY